MDILFGAGVNGPALVFLRQQASHGLVDVDLRALLQGKVAAPVLWDFLGLLDAYPEEEWFSSQAPAFEVEDSDRRLGEASMVLFVVVAVVVFIFLQVYFRSVYSKDNDNNTPGNRGRRLSRMLIVFVVFGASVKRLCCVVVC